MGLVECSPKKKLAKAETARIKRIAHRPKQLGLKSMTCFFSSINYAICLSKYTSKLTAEINIQKEERQTASLTDRKKERYAQCKLCLFVTEAATVYRQQHFLADDGNQSQRPLSAKGAHTNYTAPINHWLLCPTHTRSQLIRIDRVARFPWQRPTSISLPAQIVFVELGKWIFLRWTAVESGFNVTESGEGWGCQPN